jgi:hypothetical protein
MVLNPMGDGYEAFTKGLTEMAIILKQLSQITRIVWLQQAPVIQFGSNTQSVGYHTQIHHYNIGVRTILK